MPYKPLNLSDFKIDARVASILKLGQKEYQTVMGFDIINEEVKIVEPTIQQPIEEKKKEAKKDKKIKDIVFDFLFEPKFDNALGMFPKKARE